jgi:hypothetical protein
MMYARWFGRNCFVRIVEGDGVAMDLKEEERGSRCIGWRRRNGGRGRLRMNGFAGETVRWLV